MALLDPLSTIAGVSTARLLLSGALLLAGYSKIIDSTAFRELLKRTPWLPSPLMRPLVVLLPLVELLLGGWLIYGGTLIKVAALLTATLFVVFATVLAVLLRSGRTDACGCFGPLSNGRLHWFTVARAIVLAGLSLFLGLKVDPRAPSFGGVPAVLSFSALVFGILVIIAIARSLRSTSSSLS